MQLQARDIEFSELKANYEALKIEYAKVQGQLEEADKWKNMVGEIMSMARTVVTNREAVASGMVTVVTTAASE